MVTVKCKTLVAFMLSWLLASCALPARDNLYEALGGEVGIQRIVTNFVTNIEFDPVIIEYFVGVDIERFQQQLHLQICQLSDGPCLYEGENMEEVHKGLNITSAHFNRTVELLILAMQQAQVPYPTQNRLIRRLAPLRNEMLHK